MEISMFIVYGPIQGCYYFVVYGKYFVSKVQGSSVDKDGPVNPSWFVAIFADLVY